MAIGRFTYRGMAPYQPPQPPPFGPDRDAFNEGFKDANDKYLNRLLRDSLEAKLDKLGITDYNSAYSQLAGGRSLTSNATLSDMINNVGSLQPGTPKQENKGSSASAAPAAVASDPVTDYENERKPWQDVLDALNNQQQQQQPDPMQAVGGPGAALDSGATGFRRKRSSARMAGLTNKGTASLKITGQTSQSSGLNIG